MNSQNAARTGCVCETALYIISTRAEEGAGERAGLQHEFPYCIAYDIDELSRVTKSSLYSLGDAKDMNRRAGRDQAVKTKR